MFTPDHPADGTPPEFPFTPLPGRRLLTPERQRGFIAALARTGLVAEAATEVGVSVHALEKLRYAKGGEGFRGAWDAARRFGRAEGTRAARRQSARRTAALGFGAGDRGLGDGDLGDGGLGDGGFGSGDAGLESRSLHPGRRTSRAAFTGPEPSPEDPLLGFAPFLHPFPRRNSITPDRQRGFIAALAATGSVKQAARAIGVSLEALYTLRARGGAEGFAEAWEKAIDLGIARLEDTALARAMEGEARPIVARGEVIGEYRVHNDALVMFFLRNRRPARYGAPAERPAPPERSEREILDSINETLDRARERMQRERAERPAGD